MKNKKEAIEHIEKRLDKWTKRGNEKNVEKYTELLELFSSASDRFWVWVRDSWITFMTDDMKDLLKKQIEELK